MELFIKVVTEDQSTKGLIFHYVITYVYSSCDGHFTNIKTILISDYNGTFRGLKVQR